MPTTKLLRSLLWIKIFFYSILVSLGIGLGVYIYNLTRNAEKLRFRSAYDDAVQGLASQFAQRVEFIFYASSVFQNMFAKPYTDPLTFDEFIKLNVIHDTTNVLSGLVRIVAYSPIIYHSQRPAFENYMRNITFIDPAPSVVIPNCSLGITELQYTVPPYLGLRPPSRNKTSYVPVQFIAPLDSLNMLAVNFDLNSSASRSAAIITSYMTGKPALTDFTTLVQDKKFTLPYDGCIVERPSSLCFGPVLEKINNVATITGFVEIVFSFDSILQSAALDATTAFDFDVVITQYKSVPPKSYSFHMVKGQVTQIKPGVVFEESLAEFKYDLTVEDVYSKIQWDSIAYPTSAIYDTYVTNVPVYLALVIGFLILGAIVVFIFYDHVSAKVKVVLEKVITDQSSIFAKSKSRRTSASLFSGIIQTIIYQQLIVEKEFVNPTDIPAESLEIITELGRGEFGLVYKALMTDPSLQTKIPVAIKVLSTDNEENGRCLLLEAAIMAQFDHPNVLSLVGVVANTKKFLLVVAYCEYGSLLFFLQKKDPFNALLLSSRLKIALDVSAGLVYLHSRKFIHRDIAARNVLVDSSYRFQICDFGMSRMVDKDYVYIKTADTALPIRWTAPECITIIETSHMASFSVFSDVWAFAVLMWEVFTVGAVPYTDLKTRDVIHFIFEGGRLDKPEKCPDALWSLLRSCWVPEPTERPIMAVVLAFIEHLSPSSSVLVDLDATPISKEGGQVEFVFPNSMPLSQFDFPVKDTTKVVGSGSSANSLHLANKSLAEYNTLLSDDGDIILGNQEHIMLKRYGSVNSRSSLSEAELRYPLVHSSSQILEAVAEDTPLPPAATLSVIDVKTTYV